MNVSKRSRAFRILFLTVKWLKVGSNREQAAMTRVVVGYGRTGRSVARFFEERALPFWVADDHLDQKQRQASIRFNIVKGAQHLPNCPRKRPHLDR